MFTSVLALTGWLIANQCLPPRLEAEPLIAGIALGESGLNPYAIHDNAGGSYMPQSKGEALRIIRYLRSIGHNNLDIGLNQVNTRNFSMTGLTDETALNPCLSAGAGLTVLLARYNGSVGAAGAAYAQRVLWPARGPPARSVPTPAPPAVAPPRLPYPTASLIPLPSEDDNR